jgi:hypothetical protein
LQPPDVDGVPHRVPVLAHVVREPNHIQNMLSSGYTGQDSVIDVDGVPRCTSYLLTLSVNLFISKYSIFVYIYCINYLK